MDAKKTSFCDVNSDSREARHHLLAAEVLKSQAPTSQDQIESKIWRLVPRPCLRAPELTFPQKDDVISQQKAALCRYCILHTSCGKTTVQQRIPCKKRYFPRGTENCQTNPCSVVRIGTTTGSTGSLWLRFSVYSQTQR